MVKFSRKFAAVSAVAFLMLGAGSLSAQTESPWKGHDPNEVITTAPTKTSDFSNDSKVVYLYNVDKKQFLCVGGVNNTEAVLGDFSADAVKFLLVKSNIVGRVYLKSQYGNNDIYFYALGYKIDKGNSGQYTQEDVGEQKAFVNLSESKGSQFEGNCDIKLQSGKNGNSYTLTLNDGRYDYYLRGTNANGEVRFILNAGLSGEEWQFVTLADIKANAESKFASDNNPVDMTYLIKDANFNRCNSEYTAWKPSGYPADDEHSNSKTSADLVNNWDSPYAYFYKGNAIPDFCDKDGNGVDDWSDAPYSEEQRDNAKYFAGVLQFFQDNGSTGGAYQTITVPKAGIYRIKVRGMNIRAKYTSWFTEYEGTGNSYAFVDYNGSRDSSANFETIYDYAKYVDNNISSKNGKYYCGIDKEIKSNDKYVRELTVRVNENKKSFNLGVELANTFYGGIRWGEYDWTLFDDFTLEYLGNNVVLDENQNDVQYINDQQENDVAKTVYLKRSLKAGQWNTISLPVNLTKEQIEKTFGEGTVVSQLVDYNKEGNVINFKTTDQMIMYIPYLIKPTSKGIAEGKSVTAGNVTIEAPYYVIENVVLNPVNKLHDQYQATTDGVQFFSVFANTTDKPVHVGDYGIGTDGNWYHLTTAKNIKGFRAWMRLTDANASKIQLSVDGQNQGSVTAINGIAGDEQAPANIYNVNGQLVRSNATNANGLPKGLYIKGGKKFVVK